MISILLTALGLLNTAVFLYCLLSFIMPGSSLTSAVQPYADMILDPFRKLIRTLIPSSENWGMDFSPILLYLAIGLVSRILSLFR